MLTKPGTILVGIDGSESAARALRWAIRQATAEHLSLTLVHTVDAAMRYADAAIVDPGQLQASLDAEGDRLFGSARTELATSAPQLEVHEVFDLADPRELLVSLSENASMLVVGSHGRGPVRSLLLGSVSVALVRHAHCPVVVVRPGNPGVVRNGVVVGVDATELSHPVLEFAYRHASLHRLPLTVLHTMWDIHADTTGGYLSSFDPMDTEDERLSLAEVMAGAEEKYPDVHVTTRVATGLADENLLHLGDRMDLIVVGAHQKGMVNETLNGSVSVDVVEHATCPVAVVPLSSTQ